MDKEKPYTAPEANLDAEKNPVERDETGSRRAFVIIMFTIWIIVPPIILFVLNLLGFSNEEAVTTYDTQKGSGFRIDLLSAWYLTIPLHFYITYKRIADTSLPIWTIAILWIPVINFILCFWPPKEK